MTQRLQSACILFILGAFLGPLCDLFHNLSQTSGYPYPFFLGLAWWVPLLMGSATAFIGQSTLMIDDFFKQPKRHLSWMKVFLGLFQFAFIYFVSGFLKVETSILFLTLALIASISWYIFG